MIDSATRSALSSLSRSSEFFLPASNPWKCVQPNARKKTHRYMIRGLKMLRPASRVGPEFRFERVANTNVF